MLVQHTIAFGSADADIVVTTAGSASLDGLDALVGDLVGDERYMPGRSLLLDHSDLDWSTLQPEDLVRRVHVALKDTDLIGPSRIAVVTPDGRMGSANLVRADEPEWQTFGTVDAAQSWLAAVYVD
jgi:hypothetical protein